jgi:hypothetical protein
MPSPVSLLRVVALAVVLASLPAGTALAAKPEPETVVRVELDLPASNGLHAHLETSEKEEVTLEVWRKREGIYEGVSYEVPGQVSEAGLKVRFGRLGTIDAAFTPTETLDETEVSPGCSGAPRTLREGVFTGTISFAGERGYVRIEAPQVTGSMSVIPDWKCPEEDGMSPFEPIPGMPQLAARDKGKERESASLLAGSRGCACYFLAGVHHRHSGGRSIFYGAKEERLANVEILRFLSAPGPASAFDYDHEAGTARLDPPPPFKGHAVLRSGGRGREIWRSTIRFRLLGTALLRTGGPASGAVLYPEYQFD